MEPSGGNLPSGRVPGRAPEPSRSRVDDDGSDKTFRGILIGCLGFSVNEVFMGEGLTQERHVGPTHLLARRGWDPRRQVVWELRGSPPSLLRSPCT